MYVELIRTLYTQIPLFNCLVIRRFRKTRLIESHEFVKCIGKRKTGVSAGIVTDDL